MILDGKLLRGKILEEIKSEVEEKNYDITLAIILVGENPASKAYVRNKVKYAESCGIKTNLITYDESVSEKELIDKINELNNDVNTNGIIIQLPLPEHIKKDVVKLVDPIKDVDGFCDENIVAMYENSDGIVPCTPKGIITLLERNNIEIAGKNVVIIGRGYLVGKPLMLEMINKNATVTMCHSKTKDIKMYTLNADIIVTAVGKPNILTRDMVKDNTVIIDAGVSFVDGKQVGDSDFESLNENCLITPPTGGVGPMTIATVYSNIVKLYKKQEKVRKR